MTNENESPTQDLLIQYKLYVQMADKISQRREGANRFYVTLITSPGLILLIATQITPNTPLPTLMTTFVGGIGIILSAAWFYSIQSYKEINEAKFNVILDIEKKLSHKGFKKEWKYLQCKKHSDLTKTEKIIPWLAGFGYALLIAFSRIQSYLATLQ